MKIPPHCLLHAGRREIHPYRQPLSLNGRSHPTLERTFLMVIMINQRTDLPFADNPPRPARTAIWIGRITSWVQRPKSFKSTAKKTKRKTLRNRIILYILISLSIVGLALVVWFSLVLVLIARLTPTEPHNGLSQITKTWKKPSDSVSLLSPWPTDWSQGVTPIPCHSHNDYWRRVPLYDALAAGCTGVEADIWLESSSQDLLVGHAKRSLSSSRTLKALYIDPLVEILSQQNPNSVDAPPSTQPSGVFDTSPNTTLVLLVDMKTDGRKTWPVLLKSLEPLRSRGWLTYWNHTAEAFVPRPITVVGTGNTPFDLVTAVSNNRDVFFDAPLDRLTRNEIFSRGTSYYASVSLNQAVGKIFLWGPSQRQKEVIRDLIEAAAERGLVSRFGDIPGWPVALRTKLWNILVESGVGMLNIDDLKHASRWNWNWCVVAGLVLC